MAEELELKAVLYDPPGVRRRLLAAGARLTFQGHLRDERYDRDGELQARGEVLRVRSYHLQHGPIDAILGWKGPVRRSPEGYKQREELELPIAAGSASPGGLLRSLGYAIVHTIDREVEVYQVAGAMVRLEWFPRMDQLIEVEGTPEAIERAVAATGIPRDRFSADSLAEFVRRYEACHDHPATLQLPAS